MSPSNSKFQCWYCEEEFTAKGNLGRHLKRFHSYLFSSQYEPDSKITSKRDVAWCQEEDCNQVFGSIKLMRIHLKFDHGIAQPCLNLDFANNEAFRKWKDKLEEEGNSKWVVRSGASISKLGKKTVNYYCCRSGRPKFRGSGKRRLKTQGSKKIDNFCTSAIVYVETKQGTVKVKYYPSHYGHDDRLGHIPLPLLTKQKVAERLSEGEDPRKVLADIRKSWKGNLRRTSLITNRDIHNIKKCMGIKTDSTPKIDHVHKSSVSSVDEWVEGDHACDVLFYKRRGDRDATMGLLENDDFALVVMNSFQRTMLAKYGKDRICLDSTHGTKECDYELTTLLVANRFEEGVPVAFCLSSSVNSAIMKSFFRSVKENFGEVRCDLFLCEDDDFYEAWSCVMGRPRHYLMCAWHVDRSWKASSNLICDQVKQKSVLDCLRNCQLQANKVKFHNKLVTLLHQLDNDQQTVDFSNYLRKFFASRVDLWAYCYRTNLNINTNIHVEGFHRVLKQRYLIGRRANSAEDYVSILSEYLVDKEFDEYTKEHKGKMTTKIANMSSRHEESVEVVSRISKLGENCWLVVKLPRNDTYHVINKVASHICDSSCPVKCRLCSACLGGLACSCRDNALMGNLCKHAHAVAMYELNSQLGDVDYEIIIIPDGADGNDCGVDEIEEEKSNVSQVVQLIQKIDDRLAKSTFSITPDKVNEAINHLKAIGDLISL